MIRASPAITLARHSDDDRQTDLIIGRLDPPRIADGVLMIPGWVFGRGRQVVAVEARPRRGEPLRGPVGKPRPDVFEAVPGAPEDAGFLLKLAPEQGSGTSRLSIDALLADDTRAMLGWVEVEVSPLERSSRTTAGVEWRSVAGSEMRPIQGKAGWLFLAADRNDVIGQHTGSIELGRRSRRAWSRVLRARVTAARRLDVVWQSLIAPDKEAVYAEFLPDHVKPAPRRPVHEFLEIAERTGASCLYPLEALRVARSEMLTYRLRDTHWTDYGAYAAYRVLGEELRRRGIDLPVLTPDALAWRRVSVRDDLGEQLDPTRRGHAVGAVVRAPQARVVFDNRIENEGHVAAFESPQGRTSCVVFGGSFGAILLPFLAETFSRLIFVHTNMWIREIVEWEKPETVLSVPVERLLVEVPTDDGLPAFAEALERKRREGRFERSRAAVVLPGTPAVEDGSQAGWLPPHWPSGMPAPERPRLPTHVPEPEAVGSGERTTRETPPATVSLRAATFEDLRGLGMSITQAKRVLRDRDSGRLRSAADFAEVPGFPERFRRELEQRLTD
jgi:alginate O-acetyltransferase complex protein AlgJ